MGERYQKVKSLSEMDGQIILYVYMLPLFG